MMLGDMTAFQSDLKEATRRGLAYTVTTNLRPINRTEEIDFLYFKNPNNQDTRIYLSHLSFGTNDSLTKTIVRAYRIPDITDNGIPLQKDNRYVSSRQRDGRSNQFLRPTVANRGSLINTFILPQDSPTTKFELDYLLDPGKHILFTIQNSVRDKSSHIDLDWIETELKKR